MKSIKVIMFLAASVLAASMISCSKESPVPDNGQENIPSLKTISVSVDGLLGEYAQEDDTKASLSGAIRMKWAAGDKVYAYDGTQYLGELTVSLKNGIDYFAVLSGSFLKTPADGTTKITLVYSNVSTEAPAIADGKISIDISKQTGSTKADNMPFVAYGTLDYAPGTAEISNQIADFSFATSLMRLNCTNLEANTDIHLARLTGMGSECLLNVTNEGVSVGQGEMEAIRLDISGISASANGAQTIYAALAKTGTSEKQALEIYQKSMYEYPLSSKTRDEGKLFNTILVQKNDLLRLPGVFTVGEDGDGNPKRVCFSKGNLWAEESTKLYFEDEQWNFNSNSPYEDSHVSHFTWSHTISKAVAKISYGDFLFCDEAHSINNIGGTRISDFYYALSKDEWQYLLDDKRMEVPGKKSHTAFLEKSKVQIEYKKYSGLFIYPDDYSGEEIGSEGAPDTWVSINVKGIVFLPMAGYRDGTLVDLDPMSLNYWSSSSYETDNTKAYLLSFTSVALRPSFPIGYYFRNLGLPLRLVTNVK